MKKPESQLPDRELTATEKAAESTNAICCMSRYYSKRTKYCFWATTAAPIITCTIVGGVIGGLGAGVVGVFLGICAGLIVGIVASVAIKAALAIATCCYYGFKSLCTTNNTEACLQGKAPNP